MAEVTVRAVLPYDIRRVGETVTAVKRYPVWRSGLSRTEGRGETRFTEHAAGDLSTDFTTTAWEPCRRWEFDLENSAMTGHWTGLFSPQDGGGTEVIFTERVQPRRFLPRPVLRFYLKRQQARFVADLLAALAR